MSSKKVRTSDGVVVEVAAELWGQIEDGIAGAAALSQQAEDEQIRHAEAKVEAATKAEDMMQLLIARKQLADLSEAKKQARSKTARLDKGRKLAHAISKQSADDAVLKPFSKYQNEYGMQLIREGKTTPLQRVKAFKAYLRNKRATALTAKQSARLTRLLKEPPQK